MALFNYLFIGILITCKDHLAKCYFMKQATLWGNKLSKSFDCRRYKNRIKTYRGRKVSIFIKLFAKKTDDKKIKNSSVKFGERNERKECKVIFDSKSVCPTIICSGTLAFNF